MKGQSDDYKAVYISATGMTSGYRKSALINFVWPMQTLKSGR